MSVLKQKAVVRFPRSLAGKIYLARGVEI
jgi:hypothetical protein